MKIWLRQGIISILYLKEKIVALKQYKKRNIVLEKNVLQ